MPHKRKGSPYYWASLGTDELGKQIRKNTKTTDRREAVALEAKWKSELHAQANWDKDPSISFEDVMVHYLSTRDPNQTPGAKEANARRVMRLTEHYAGLTMNNLSARDVKAHRNTRMRTVGPATINRELTVLSAAINAYNLDFETNLHNPVKGRRVKEPEGRLRWLQRDEADALISAAAQSAKAPYLADLITLALHSGMRRGELLSLEWRHIDMKGRTIHLETQNTKAKKRRSIPINQSAKIALGSRLSKKQQYRDDKGRPTGKYYVFHRNGDPIASIKKGFATACKNAEITDFRFHDIRHTCAAWLITAGVALIEVRDLLGHANIRMTERYAHLAPDNVRNAVSVLDNEVKLRIVK